MKRIMIVDSDSEFTKELSDFFSSSDCYEVVGSAADGNSAFELIPSLKPDVIILDVILPKTDGLSVLKHYGMNEELKIIVVSSLNIENLASKCSALGADYFMLKPLSFLNLKDNIDELFVSKTEKITMGETDKINYEKNLIDEKITNIFIQIGIPANIKGYLFLKEAIKITMTNLEIINSITKKLYPQVADRFNTNPCGVERGIRHAIEVAWNRGKLININSIFGLYIYDTNEKPSNGELIALLAYKLLL